MPLTHHKSPNPSIHSTIHSHILETSAAEEDVTINANSTKSDCPKISIASRLQSWFRVKSRDVAQVKRKSSDGHSRRSKSFLLPCKDLLPKLHDSTKKCLVLDLDETLIHSTWKHTAKADFVVPILMGDNIQNVSVLKRPGVDQFLKVMGEIYEIVIFTASLSNYANPIIDQLDVHGVVKHRLFRNSCCNHKGVFVKDLSRLGREMNQVLIIDNSPFSYLFQPQNALAISTWVHDPYDTQLLDLMGILVRLSHSNNLVEGLQRISV